MPVARVWYSLAALVLLAGARAPKPAAPPSVAAVDTVKVKAAVADFWQKWIAAGTAGSITGMAALVTDSVRVDIKGNPAVLGKAAWQVAAESMSKGVQVLSEAVTPDITIAVSDDLAWQNGNYAEATLGGKKKTTEYGRYASAIRKGSDGTWRLQYIMAFSDSSIVAK